MLTPEQKLEFETRGIVRLSQAVDAEVVTGIRQRVLEFLAGEPADTGRYPSLTRRVMSEFAFEPGWGPVALAAVDDFLGAGRWHAPRVIGQLLPMLAPDPARVWALPHQSWHLDYRAPGALAEPPGVQIFLCLDRVEPQGGATLCIAGSHRLVDALRRRKGAAWDGASSEARRGVARDVEWLRALFSLRAGEDRCARFMTQPTEWRGIPLQVVALAGEPGDVLLMHPWMLHAASPNCGARPRMVVTERIHYKLPQRGRDDGPASRQSVHG
jgi:phytanoyl-CoA dioxygenase PhyH